MAPNSRQGNLHVVTPLRRSVSTSLRIYVSTSLRLYVSTHLRRYVATSLRLCVSTALRRGETRQKLTVPGMAIGQLDPPSFCATPLYTIPAPLRYAGGQL